jgi:outer membrane protein OmpA-like peptidoglycan-associated protein
MGATGRPGEAGPQGPVGSTGAQGPAGIVSSWASYRDFWFESGQDGIRPSDTKKVSEIAAYVNQNPSLQVGIDTFVDPGNEDLRGRRVNAVRKALIQAGVPAQKIVAGAFANANSRRNARVEVLLRTASPNYTASQY